MCALKREQARREWESELQITPDCIVEIGRKVGHELISLSDHCLQWNKLAMLVYSTVDSGLTITYFVIVLKG